MFPAIGAILSKVAPAIVGGLFAARQAKIDRRNAIADGQVQFERLRESAERADFNPLTALMHGGLGAFQNIPSGAPPLASTQFLTEGVQGVADILTGKDAQKQAREQLEMDLLKLQMESYKADIAASSVRTRQMALGAQQPAGARVTARPGQPLLSDGPLQPMTPRFDPDPALRRVPVDPTPSTLMADDGLTRANPDAPAQPEEDLWKWGRDGTFFTNIDEVIQRNITKDRQAFTWWDPSGALRYLPKLARRAVSSDPDRRFNMQ